MEGLETYKSNRFKIDETKFERLVLLAQINPLQFKRLWLLHQYQHYRLSINFQAVGDCIREYYRTEYKKELYKNPSRKNRLTKMHQLKQQEFLQFFNNLSRELNFNFFEYALYADVENLLYPNTLFQGFTTPLKGEVLRLESQNWQSLLESNDLNNINIILPADLEKRFREEYNTLQSFFNEEIYVEF